MTLPQPYLRVEIVPDDLELAERAAAVVVETLRVDPAAVISITTGRTLTALFKLLRDRQRAGRIDLAGARLICSEEYAGVDPSNPISLFGWLCRDLLAPCGIAPERVLHFAGHALDVVAECVRFDDALRAWGGADLVVQSIGVNGHYGFNEPGSPRDAPSRRVRLAPSTLRHNSAYWPAGTQIPCEGLTMGVATVLGARHVLLLASGEQKAEALALALTGPIDDAVPASLLRLAPRVTVIAEAAAARNLEPISTDHPSSRPASTEAGAPIILGTDQGPDR